MNKKNEFVAEFNITKDGITVVDTKMSKDGFEVSRRMPLIDFINLIAQKTVIKEESRSFDYGSVLELRGNLLYTCGNTKGDLGIVLEIPKNRHFFNAFEKSYMLPFPRLVIALILSKNGSRKFFKIFSAKDIGRDSDLYLYPFGNVSKAGDVCMGSAYYKIDAFRNTTFADVQKVIDAFFSAKTSGHYYVAGETVKLPMELPDFISYINSCNEFPDEILTKSKETMASIFSAVSRKIEAE